MNERRGAGNWDFRTPPKGKGGEGSRGVGDLALALALAGSNLPLGRMDCHFYPPPHHIQDRIQIFNQTCSFGANALEKLNGTG